MTRTRSPKPGQLLSLLAGSLVAAVALLGPPGAAPTARADTTDDAFIQALKNEDITHESRQAAIMAGHLVCQELGQGKTKTQIATDVLNSSSLDGDNAGYFVAASVLAYCPQHADEE
jgi:Protein of unknown function (DUF732)